MAVNFTWRSSLYLPSFLLYRSIYQPGEVCDEGGGSVNYMYVLVCETYGATEEMSNLEFLC